MYIYIVVIKLCPDSLQAMDCSPSVSSVRGILQEEYWSGLPRPPPGDLPDPGIELVSLALAGGLFIAIVIWEAQTLIYI